MPRHGLHAPLLSLIALLAAAGPASGLDTDGDGISDEVEMNGVPGQPLLDFPAMGADPNVPDVFVQADWVTCDPIIEHCGPNNSLDHNQLSSKAAAEMAAFFAPDIMVHVDNGVLPPRPELVMVHGDWGGARRLPRGSQPCNSSVLGARYGYFHRGTFAGLNGGGGGVLYGFCFGGNSVYGSVGAHELGHNLGLSHGGNEPSYPANCKPNYQSPMNYAFLYDRDIEQFSRGGLADVVLDPTAMDEQLGLGTGDPTVLGIMRSGPWGHNVRDDGAIDWNRDGRFDTELVRAAPNWARASCEQSTAHTDFFPPGDEPTMTWLPELDAPRLYLFARRAEDGMPAYHVATRFDGCDPADEPESCADWSPRSLDPGIAVPGAFAGSGAIAAAGWESPDGARLLVVHADQSGQLHAQRLMRQDGADRWEAPVAIPGAFTDANPALALLPGDQRMLLVAPEDGWLRRWEYDIADGTWSGPRDEVWEDGTLVELCHGVALARGFERGDDGMGEQVYAAVPAGRYCELTLARRSPEGPWQRLGDQVWSSSEPPLTGARPGLAYVPFDPAVPEEGRLYIAWRPFPSGAALISHTEGNDARAGATDRRLRFWYGTYLRNYWAVLTGGIGLGFDIRFDDNLRATWTYINGGVQLQPFADGIIAVDMHDQDDYAYMLENLACSLTRSCMP